MSGEECPAPNCYRQLQRNELACKAHWARVHPETKAAVASAYRVGDLPAHAKAMRDAVDDMGPTKRGGQQ